MTTSQTTNTTEPVRFIHLTLGEGRVTLAYRHDEKQGDDSYAAAFCSPKDQFWKKKGRLIAQGRLDTGKILWFGKCPSDKRHEYVLASLKNLVEINDSAIPRWLREAYCD